MLALQSQQRVLAMTTTAEGERGMMRLVRAAGNCLYGYIDPSETPNTWAASNAVVRAVLEALKQPSEGMVEAGHRYDEDHAGGSSPQEIFTAMIDAALNEGGGE